ncbi:MAG: hypothetical protein ACJAUP_001214 [Cellvibrionaceae bacterium]|jgi:hypothetical protein
MSVRKNKSSFGITLNTELLAINLGLIILFNLPLSAFAWGPLGHKSICDAAWRASKPNLQKDLADAAKRMGYNTYAESCLWADKIRSDQSYRWVKPLHYMNLARGELSAKESNCFAFSRKPTCVGSAIDYYQKRWRDASLDQNQRDQALLLFSHFVADIHQPLHVAYRDDRGGTRQMVVFEGKLMSLHSLWDSDILHCGTNARWRGLGKQLYRRHSAYKTSQFSDLSDWADESFALTRTIYTKLEKRLPKHYCQTFHPLAVARLELASLRLVGLFAEQSSVEQAGGEGRSDGLQSAPNLIERFTLLFTSLFNALWAALWKSILTLLP